MKRFGNIVRYPAEKLDEMRCCGERRTDWTKVDAMTEEELEARIAADPDDTHEPIDWSQSIAGLPPGLFAPKKHVNIRLDADVLDWFKQAGRGYRTRINAVLRSFVASSKREAR